MAGLKGEWKPRNRKLPDGPQREWLEGDWSCDDQVEKGAGLISVRAVKFRGRLNDTALVFAGVHGDELEGTVAARRLIERFQDPKTEPPAFTTIVIERLFAAGRFSKKDPRYVQGERENFAATWVTSKSGKRVVKWPTKEEHLQIEANRNFPRVGEGYADVLERRATRLDGRELVDYYDRFLDWDRGEHLTDLMLAENRILVQLVERERPLRVASLHGKRLDEKATRGDGPGIFVDPRGGFGSRTTWKKRGKDDDVLARRMLDAALSSTSLSESLKKRTDFTHPFSGNLMKPIVSSAKASIDLNTRNATVHYTSARHPPGTSFGMWASAEELFDEGGVPKRPEMPVITVEMARYAQEKKKDTSMAAPLVDPIIDALVKVFLIP